MLKFPAPPENTDPNLICAVYDVILCVLKERDPASLRKLLLRLLQDEDVSPTQLVGGIIGLLDGALIFITGNEEATQIAIDLIEEDREKYEYTSWVPTHDL